MNVRGIGFVALLVCGVFSIARAQVEGVPPPTSTTEGICGQPDHATTFPGVVCDCADLATIHTITGCENAAQVVCINNFQYNPSQLNVAVGATVAWVNLETCGDFAPEDLVVNTLGVGCDTHHQVVTLPPVPGVTGDTISEMGICAPSPGIQGAAVPPPVPSACGTTETNVRCHTFASSGIQHYSCETNPGHTALMHGFIAAQ